jgi:hypothetical protein
MAQIHRTTTLAREADPAWAAAEDEEEALQARTRVSVQACSRRRSQRAQACRRRRSSARSGAAFVARVTRTCRFVGALR